MSDWHETDQARELLCLIDAYERSSDRYAGMGWHELSACFASMAEEAESDLDALRSDAVEAIADAASDNRDSDEWLDAWTDTDDDLDTVASVIATARKQHWGDGLMEQAA